MHAFLDIMNETPHQLFHQKMLFFPGSVSMATADTRQRLCFEAALF